MSQPRSAPTLSHLAPIPSGGAVAKRIKFGWKVSGQPPRYEMVLKGSLFVDSEYQRSLSDLRATRIASNWDWVACGALKVARRSDGSLWVFDGQHRRAGAMKRDDINFLPCLIYDVISVEQEAAGFHNTNTTTKHLSSVDKFKALVLMKDEAALAVKGLIEGSEYTVSSTSGDSGKTVKCVGVLVKYSRSDLAALQQLWPALIDAHSGGPFHEWIVQSLWYLNKDTKGLILTGRYRDRIKKLGRDVLLAAIRRSASAYVTGGDRVWAQGLLEEINSGFQKKNRIVFGTGGKTEMTAAEERL